jgi:hypothetical protein
MKFLLQIFTLDFLQALEVLSKSMRSEYFCELRYVRLNMIRKIYKNIIPLSIGKDRNAELSKFKFCTVWDIIAIISVKNQNTRSQSCELRTRF